VARARPEVIVHQLTAIESLDPRHFDRDFALTNRLRSEGTDYLLSAGQAMKVRRFVAQSAVYALYARTGGPVKSEEDPLDPTPGSRDARDPGRAPSSRGGGPGGGVDRGIVLRYGAFYGPGTSLTAGGEQFEIVRKQQVPGGRRRGRRVVLHPHRRCRGGDGEGGGAR